jgi:hypothetical protein
MSSVAKDFVSLFHQQRLVHLTREIMLLLIGQEEEECGLPEAKLVSRTWRKTVTSLVLRTDEGRSMCMHRLKNMMRG